MSFTETLSALVEDGDVLAGLLLAFAVAWLVTPLAGRLARATGRLDGGDDRPRIHTIPTPNTGGVAVVLAIAVGALAFVELEGSMAGIFLGLGLVMLIGLWDDRRGMAPMVKLVLLVAVTLVPVAAYGLAFERVTLPFLGDGDLGWIAYPLTVAWIVLVANLVNLIDGMDGLAGGIVAIAAATLALLAVSFGRLEVAAVAAAVCGATLGFLQHNLHPAKIFMGDSGSLSLGYLLAALSVEGLLKTPATITLLAPLLIVAVPLMDTSFVVLKRLKYHRPVFGADQNHFHYRFLRIGFSQRRSAAYLHLWAGALAAWATLVRFVPPRPSGDWELGPSLIVGASGLAVAIGSVWMVYTLEILKFRRLDALRLRRTRPTASEAEIRAEIAHDLETGEFEAVSAETGGFGPVGQ